MINNSNTTPSTTIFDIIPYGVDCAQRGILGVFKRVIGVPTLFFQAFFPDSAVAKRLSYPEGYVLLDDHEIDVECKDNPELQSTMRRTQTFVNGLRFKLGIQQEVAIYINPTHGQAGSCIGSRASSNKIGMILNGFAFYFPQEELEFLIAHELSHAAHNDGLKVWAYNLAIIIAEMATAYCLTPYAIPLIEIASAPLDWTFCYFAEKNADLSAIKVLRTAEGAISFFQRGQKGNLNKENRGDRFSPEGDDRHDLFHPRLSERIRYCIVKS